MKSSSDNQPSLARVIGLSGAVLLGLGSILGTGAFVSIGLGAGLADSYLPLAIALAAILATLNGLSSARLAGAFPVSGGTYEYGYRTLGAFWGRLAGWSFLLAKSASAATAALGLSGYALHLLDLSSPTLRLITALLFVVLIALGLSFGMRRSNRLNGVIVTITLTTLLCFIAAGIFFAPDSAMENRSDRLFDGSEFWEAVALLFVAFTGYGRIATLGEEVVNPQKTIPQAIYLTLSLSALLYIGIGWSALRLAPPQQIWEWTTQAGAPLEMILQFQQWPLAAKILSIGGLTAMAGVLLNLLLGLSRVLFAMGRRQDVPTLVARVDHQQPLIALWTIAAIICIMVLTQKIQLTWSFSAFNVLLYYGITNVAAFRLKDSSAPWRKHMSLLGATICLLLLPFIQWPIAAASLAVLSALTLFSTFKKKTL